MSAFFLILFFLIFVVFTYIGLRYPEVRRDWRLGKKGTARVLASILISLLIFFLLWYFLAQQKLPDIIISATYFIFIVIGLLFIAALVLRK
jgi:hypothetical protein